MLAFITWDVNPEVFSILGREIRWYGICWALGVFLTSYIVQKTYAHEKLPEKWFDSLFLYVLIGLIVGARLGHCLFYSPEHYLANPLEMFKIWEGGLASHGGVIGMVIALCMYSYRISKKSPIWAFDRLVVGATLGGALIRVGNLMNSEIYGDPTTMPWGFNFVRDRDWSKAIADGGSGALPCHPTQIYEALVYFSIFTILMYMYWKTKAKDKQGLLSGVALIGVFLSRFCIEFIKNLQEGFEMGMQADYGINMGQLLSIPFILWGVWLVWNASKKRITDNYTTI